MVPLLMPGAIVVIDPRVRSLSPSVARSRGLLRPLYFLQLRNRFACCWCEMTGSRQLITYSDPASPTVDDIFRSEDVTILGRVVAVFNPLDGYESGAGVSVRTHLR